MSAKKTTVIPPKMLSPQGDVFAISNTDKEGVFLTWSGDTLNYGFGLTTYTAYVYSADGQRVYYSNANTGYTLTIPEEGEYQAYVCAENTYVTDRNKEIVGFGAALLKCPEGKNDWEDDGKGTLTAIVSDRVPEEVNPAFIGINAKIPEIASLRTLSADEQAKLSSPAEYIMGSDNPTEEEKRKGLISFRSNYGTIVRDIYIPRNDDSKKPSVIAVLADMHINVMDDVDVNDAEMMFTNKTRYWGRGASLVPHAMHGLAFADMYDKTILAGDILDIMAHGSRQVVKEKIIDKYPGIMMTIGGHDTTKNMETGIPDALPLCERRAFLQEVWPHNLVYHSEVVNDSVLCIVAANDLGRYLPEQVEKLKADIEKARKNNYTVLIFQHEPMASGNPEHTEVPCLDANPPAVKAALDFYGTPHVGGVGRNDPPETEEFCSIIRNSPDVIKGIFAGHRHYNYYYEMLAKNPDGTDAVIPNYVIRACAYNDIGCVTRVFI